MEVGDLVVGTPDCPINTITSILREDASLMENWSSLAMGLGIPSVAIRTLKNDLLLCKTTHSDLICEVLEQWVGMKASNARLIVLILVLEGDCKADEAIKYLGRHFNLSDSFYNSISWKDLTVSLEAKVVRNIYMYFPSLSIESVKPIFNGSLLLHLMRDTPSETLPEGLSYYVNRRIRTKNVISTKIFENGRTDLLLVSGIQRHELSRLAKDKVTDHSANQIRQGAITVKHMILDSPTHFDKICKLADTDKQHVHCLRFVDKKLKWIRSSGGISLVHSYIDKEQLDLDEEEFSEQFDPNSNSPVCISDGPGMGKSIFLAQMGRRLKAQYPERTIIFLVLGEIIKRTREFDMDALLSSMLKSDKEESSSVTIELLLDGLDEVDSADLEFVFGWLRQISTCQSIRLWVSTRIHLLDRLEGSLNTIGFHINPFSVEDQARFLRSYWLDDKSLNDDSFKVKLSRFAQHCLTALKSTIKSNDSDIAGVPLQCLLIGEVYAEEAQAYATAETSTFPLLLINSVTSMYEALIDRKFSKKGSTIDIETLKDMHAALALELIFPEMYPNFKNLFSPVDMEEILKVGILEASGTTGGPRFIHRTFAEYFVAWWVVRRLIPCDHEEATFPDFFFANILGCIKLGGVSRLVLERNHFKSIFEFTSPVITYFLNSLIVDTPPISELPANNFINQLQSNYNRLKDRIFLVALATAQSDYFKIHKFLFQINAFDNQMAKIFDHEFIFCTFRHSCLPFIKFALSQFEKYHKFDTRQIQAEALSLACQRGDFSIVEFLVNDRQLKWLVEKTEHNNLLFDCIELSMTNSPLVINDKIQVIRMLHEINPSILEIHDEDGKTPLLAYDGHSHLVIELIRLGANATAVDRFNRTALHLPNIFRNVKSSDYHQLIMSIPEDSLRTIVKVVTCDVYKATPLCALFRYLPDPDVNTLEVFKAAGANFNQESEDDDQMTASVLALAVQNGSSGSTIRHLIRLGAKAQWKHPWRRQSLLHYAAESGNKEAVAILVEYVDVNVTNTVFQTPLDRAILNECEDEFIAGLTLAGRSTENLKSNGKRYGLLKRVVKLLDSESDSDQDAQ